jgi:hypothetical protein
VRDADQIVVLQGGRFNELMKINGSFAQLIDQGQFVADAVESAGIPDAPETTPRD